MLAEILIMIEAYKGIMAPRVLDARLQGLILNGVASVIDGLWCWILITEGRRVRSPALVADGHHLLSDVISSAAVLLGVRAAIETGWAFLDPALAGLVALNFLSSGWKVMKGSLSGLLDESAPHDVLRTIKDVIALEAIGALEVHDLRTRHAGKVTVIDFHLVVPGETTVTVAHEICDRIEKGIKERILDASIIIHVEPEHKIRHTGVLVLS